MPDYRDKKFPFHSFFRRSAFSPSFQEKIAFLPSGLMAKEYALTVPALSGQSFLFFTDTHIQAGKIRNLCSPQGHPSSWSGTAWMESALQEALHIYTPDYLLFGGDLVTYSSQYPDAVAMLSHLRGKRGQFAVYGNWDKRRRSWFPFSEIERIYSDAGWTILDNEAFSSGEFELYGMDDYKIGIPRFYRTESKPAFSLLLSHNPDAVAEMPPDELSHFDLALCGHTHGGQIRIPAFGAIKASSKYWKRFEYGAYENRIVKTRMIVSSGIGTTFLHYRINCPPEIIVLNFK